MPMFLALVPPALINGFILGWSVAWPPGPVNAEIIRRGILPHHLGGGFWSAWLMGLGACTGDFLWALGVSAGAGALMTKPIVHLVLGIVSLLLLLFLAGNYAIGAWRTAHHAAGPAAAPRGRKTRAGGFLLGFTMVLTSPFNIGFWFAVIGSQQSGQLHHSLGESLALAGSVVLGAITWGFVLSTAVKFGARIFARPAWQICTQALTALVMLFFAGRLAWQLF